MLSEHQGEKPTLELLEWRVLQLENLLRDSYITVSEMRNVFLTREEVKSAAEIHRQWPVIVFTGILCTCNLVELLLLLKSAH